MVATRKQILSGFTLIELMITLVVLVILITLAAPSFVDTLDRRRIVDAAETMVKQVQQARAVAVESGREISMVFDDSGANWCFGLTDRIDADGADCDCYQTLATHAEACTIPFGTASPTFAGEEFELVRASGDQFQGVALQAFPAELRFEPLRGVRVDAAARGISPTVVIEFLSARGREAHVLVNLLGRAATCSPDAGGSPSVSTMRACP